jgi:hypothetical protein
LKVKDQTVYDDWVKKNSGDAYSAAIFRYAEAWADLMEEQMAQGELVEYIAEKTSRTADTEGITGFMYGAAVSILSQCWIYGEDLRRWHNVKTQIGTEGETANKNGGVLNPALLNIG